MIEKKYGSIDPMMCNGINLFTFRRISHKQQIFTKSFQVEKVMEIAVKIIKKKIVVWSYLSNVSPLSGSNRSKSDITNVFSEINLNKQGKYTFSFHFSVAMDAIKKRLQILEDQFRVGILDNFKYMKESCEHLICKINYQSTSNHLKISAKSSFGEILKNTNIRF